MQRAKVQREVNKIKYESMSRIQRTSGKKRFVL
jgi:hypothetical protein